MSKDERIKKLKSKLEGIAAELEYMIIRENDRLKSQITSTDPQPPDYIDFQTVAKAMKLINET